MFEYQAIRTILQAPVTHWYQDQNLWTAVTAVAAVAAIVLSQLPPLKTFLKRAKIKIQTHNRISITDVMGNPNVNLFVQLMNAGGRAVRVTSMRLELKADEVTLTLPAQGFWSQDLTRNFLFTPFTFLPTQEWAGTVNFFVPWPMIDEKAAKQISRDMRNDIAAKKIAAPNPNELVEADKAIVERALSFYRRSNKWHPNDYAAKLVVTVEPARASTSREFRFTLFESDTQDLADRTLRYKYGLGVCFRDEQSDDVSCRIKDAT